MKIKKYRVKSLYLGGRNRTFNQNDIVTQYDFKHKSVDELVKKGYLEDLTIEVQKYDISKIKLKNNPPKIAVITAMWKRESVFHIFSKQINKIKSEFKDEVEIEVFVSGSEGVFSKSLAQKYGFNYSEVPNNPLGSKMNTALKSSVKFNADYYLFLGSDDIFCSNLMKQYLLSIANDIEFTQILDCYFYDLNLKRALYWGGYDDFRKGKGVGAGRFVSANIIEHFNHQIWANNVNKGLDYTFDVALRKINYSFRSIRLKEFNAYLLDIKNEDSITKFTNFSNSKEINSQALKSKFKHLNIN